MAEKKRVVYNPPPLDSHIPPTPPTPAPPPKNEPPKR